MLVLCHGMVKSASSFATQIVYGLVSHRAHSLGRRIRSLSEFTARPQSASLADSLFLFDHEPIDEVISRALEGLHDSKGDFLIVKLHRACTPFIASLIRDGTVRAISTHRDPRDIALSLLDAARRDMESGRARFTQFDTLNDALKAVEYQIDCFSSWAELGNVEALSFDELTAIPYSVSVRLARYLACAPIGSVVAELVQNSESIWEFNKGVRGRWREEKAWSERSEWQVLVEKYEKAVTRAAEIRSVNEA
jgi:hypothetical protein